MSFATPFIIVGCIFGGFFLILITAGIIYAMGIRRIKKHGKKVDAVFVSVRVQTGKHSTSQYVTVLYKDENGKEYKSETKNSFLEHEVQLLKNAHKFPIFHLGSLSFIPPETIKELQSRNINQARTKLDTNEKAYGVCKYCKSRTMQEDRVCTQCGGRLI